MKKLMKILALSLVATALLALTVSCGSEDDSGLEVVTSVFLPCDFARTIARERASVTQLLPLGSEGHDWEPPAKLLREVASADLFIYVGGGGDKWAEKLLSSADVADAIEAGSLRVLCLYDSLDLTAYYPEAHDGHTHDLDTHFWTSPVLAADIAEAIASALSDVDPDGRESYEASLSELLSSLSALDSDFRAATVGGGKIYFGDKFAFYYLCREYGLDYLSPYAGCTDDALPIDRVVIEMKAEVRELDIPLVFCEEYNSASPLAASIAEECGATVAELHSCHNLNKSDSDANLDYLTLMRRNLELIKEAIGGSVDG